MESCKESSLAMRLEFAGSHGDEEGRAVNKLHRSTGTERWFYGLDVAAVLV